MLTLDVSWGGGNSGTTEVSDGDWHHVAMVIEDEMILFYSDGEDAGEAPVGENEYADDAFIITIGWDPRCGMEYPPFIGIIDEVSIYNRALSEDEIVQNFEAGVLDLAVEPAHKLAGTWGAMKVPK